MSLPLRAVSGRTESGISAGVCATGPYFGGLSSSFYGDAFAAANLVFKQVLFLLARGPPPDTADQRRGIDTQHFPWAVALRMLVLEVYKDDCVLDLERRMYSSWHMHWATHGIPTAYAF
jgi:hypothetical protein